MPVRKKSKFEQWFSFSRHQRRFGAEKIYAQFVQADLNQLKNTIIDGDQIQYTHGSAKDLNEYIEQLKQEFDRQSALNNIQAIMIVLIFCEVDSQIIYDNFK